MDTTTVARQYQQAGWHPIELPAGAKSPPPDGRTGYDGADMTLDEVSQAAWAGNIGLRMPSDVIGLDIDAYNGGLETYEKLKARLGWLPNTWISHNGRNDGSGIRFYRVPQQAWITGLPGIEIIQRNHRYSVAWPSTHPDGRRYELWDQAEGGPTTDIPLVEDLPELPWAWQAELGRATHADASSTNGAVARAVDKPARDAFLADHTAADAPSYIATIVAHFTERHNANYSRHDTMQHCLTWAMENVAAGVAAGEPTVTALGRVWAEAVADSPRRAELYAAHRTTEFDAMLRHAIGKAKAKTAAELARYHDSAAGIPIGDSGQPPVIDVYQEPPSLFDPDPAHIISFRDLPDPYVIPELTWHAENLLCQDTHGELAGAEKSLKSYIGLILDVGLAAGLDVLGKFPVAGRRRVTVLVGEGGEGPFLRRLAEVCAGYGIQPGDLKGWLRFTTEHARINTSRFLDGIRHELETFGPGLIHADPWYTYQPAGTESSQLVSVGMALDAFAATCRAGGATAWLNHHFNRTDQSGLRQITGAGHAEWVDSWMLTSHRQPPDVTNGRYWLRLEVGSRQWGGGSYDVELTTAAPPLTKIWWKATDAAPSGAAAAFDPFAQVKVDVLKTGKKAQKPLTKEGWVERVNHRKPAVRAAFDELVDDGLIVPVGSHTAANGRTYPTYEPIPPTP